MKKAVIKDGFVENIIEVVDNGFKLEGAELVDFVDGCHIGGRYKDGVFILPEPKKKEGLDRIEEIKNLLVVIDLKTIRPLRSGDKSILDQLEIDADILRAELRELQEKLQ